MALVLLSLLVEMGSGRLEEQCAHSVMPLVGRALSFLLPSGPLRPFHSGTLRAAIKVFEDGEWAPLLQEG